MARFDYNPSYSYDNYSFVLPFERDFDTKKSTIWMQDHFHTTYFWAAGYLVAIFSGRKIMENRKPFHLDTPLFIWNTFLALFSLLGLIRVFPEWWWSLFGNSFNYSVCTASYTVGIAGYWGDKFAMSKIVELIDTAFIVLKKRKLIFLHYYHHVTVLIYTWYSYKDHNGAARWFVVMNYAVHSLMYSYYALSAIKIRPPKMIAMVITTLQISQMFMGCYIGYYVYNILSNGGECQQNYKGLILGFIMYFTYFLLFCNFFYQSYVKRGGRNAKKAIEEKDGLVPQKTEKAE